MAVLSIFSRNDYFSNRVYYYKSMSILIEGGDDMDAYYCILCKKLIPILQKYINNTQRLRIFFYILQHQDIYGDFTIKATELAKELNISYSCVNDTLRIFKEINILRPRGGIDCVFAGYYPI